MMKIRVYVDMEFVDGNLKGIKLENEPFCDYPASEYNQVCESFVKDVMSKRVLGVFGSKYILNDFRTEFL